MKRSAIKRRPLADSVLSALEPDDKDYRERDSDGLYFRGRRTYCFQITSYLGNVLDSFCIDG